MAFLIKDGQLRGGFNEKEKLKKKYEHRIQRYEDETESNKRKYNDLIKYKHPKIIKKLKEKIKELEYDIGKEKEQLNTNVADYSSLLNKINDIQKSNEVMELEQSYIYYKNKLEQKQAKKAKLDKEVEELNKTNDVDIDETDVLAKLEQDLKELESNCSTERNEWNFKDEKIKKYVKEINYFEKEFKILYQESRDYPNFVGLINKDENLVETIDKYGDSIKQREVVLYKHCPFDLTDYKKNFRNRPVVEPTPCVLNFLIKSENVNWNKKVEIKLSYKNENGDEVDQCVPLNRVEKDPQRAQAVFAREMKTSKSVPVGCTLSYYLNDKKSSTELEIYMKK